MNDYVVLKEILQIGGIMPELKDKDASRKMENRGDFYEETGHNYCGKCIFCLSKCPECGSTELREEKGETYCKKCGIVVD